MDDSSGYRPVSAREQNQGSRNGVSVNHAGTENGTDTPAADPQLPDTDETSVKDENSTPSQKDQIHEVVSQ